jgi:hypothetical protein
MKKCEKKRNIAKIENFVVGVYNNLASPNTKINKFLLSLYLRLTYPSIVYKLYGW